MMESEIIIFAEYCGFSLTRKLTLKNATNSIFSGSSQY